MRTGNCQQGRRVGRDGQHVQREDRDLRTSGGTQLPVCGLSPSRPSTGVEKTETKTKLGILGCML